MNIFRKNYLPKVVVHQDTDGLWFADNGLDLYNPDYRVFIHYFGLVSTCEERRYNTARKYDTLDDLFTALYEYACAEHLKAVKENLTYQRVQVQL
jgi:hypothetical protein